MTIAEKLNELDYENYGNGIYSKFVYMPYELGSSFCIKKTIEIKNDGPSDYYVQIVNSLKLNKTKMIGELTKFISDELNHLKRDFSEVMQLNQTPKERVEEFLQECELYEEETNGSAEELPCYKTLVRDLEVLNILKESLNYNFF